MPVFKSTQRSSARFRCDAALLYEILVDYDGYVEWLPLVAQSKVLATEGDLAIAEFHAAGPKKQRFVVECIHTRNRMVLWRTIEGDVSVTQVEWNIEPAGEGQCLVNLAVERAMGWKGLIAGSKLLNPPAALKGLEAQVASFVPELAISDAAGEKLLELSETEDGLICWIRGKKYVLKEAATN